MAADEEQSWVDQVQQTEQALIDIISLDGDLVVEALSSIPPDARGRLQTMMVLAEEVVIQAAHGYHIVVDTGLGTAGWQPVDEADVPDTEAAEADDSQPDPALVQGQSWADVVDLPVLALQSGTAVEPASTPDAEQPKASAEAQTQVAAVLDNGTAVTQPATVAPTAQVQPKGLRLQRHPQCSQSPSPC